MGSAGDKHQRKLAVLAVITLIALLGMALYLGMTKPSPHSQAIQTNGFALSDPQVVADFHLLDNAGQAFTNNSLKGHWTLMFFGFTHCGMVCPATMSALNQMYQSLAEELPVEQLPQVVMVSVDPLRDTIDRMNEYVTAVNPHFIGARGEAAEIEALEKAFHLAALKPQDNMINHHSKIVVINPEGKLQAYMSLPYQPGQMAANYKSLLKG